MTTLLSMTISASVIIAVIIVIRPLFIHKLPKRLFVMLWTAAALRMLVPLSVPVNIPHENTQPENAVVRDLSPQEAVTASGTSVAPDCELIFGIVWAGGVVLSLGIIGAFHLRSRRELSTALPLKNAEINSRIAAEKFRRKITVKVSGRVTSPLTYGVINPVIILPKNLPADSGEMRFALAHELVHIRRFDVLLKLILTAAACAHWFNPLAWAMLSLAGRDIELSCDEAVLKKLGCKREDYAMALIRLEERRSIPTGAAFGGNAVRERIEAIMKFKKTTLAGIIVSVCLIAGTSTAFAAVNSENPAPEAVAAAEAGNSYVTDTENAELIMSEEVSASEFTITDIGGQSGTDEVYQFIIEDDGTVPYSDEQYHTTKDVNESEISDEEFFSRYEQYGLTYEDGKLYYNGEPVQYFEDVVDTHSTDDGGTTEFRVYLDSDGALVLNVERAGATDDSVGEITRVRVASGEAAAN